MSLVLSCYVVSSSTPARLNKPPPSLCPITIIIPQMLISLIPWEYAEVFAIVPTQGLWPILMATITTNALSDPSGSSSFLCFTLNNRVYPWFLVFFFSLLSFFPLLDLLLGVVVGHLASWGWLKRLYPTARSIQAMETGSGWAVRAGMTLKTGFVYGPETSIPPGARALDREAMAEQWAMFDPTARRRLMERQRQQQQQGGGAGDGDEEGGGYSGAGHVFRPNRLRQPGGATVPAAAPVFSGGGRALGSTSDAATVAGQTASSSSAAAGSHGPSVTSVIGGLFGRGAASAAPSAPAADVGAGAAAAAAADPAALERRRAAAAAAEARLRATANRGITPDSPRMTQHGAGAAPSAPPSYVPFQGQGRALPSTSAAAKPQAPGAAAATGNLLGLSGGNTPRDGVATNPVAAPHSQNESSVAGVPINPRTAYGRAVAAAAAARHQGGGAGPAAAQREGERSGLLAGGGDDDELYDEVSLGSSANTGGAATGHQAVHSPPASSSSSSAPVSTSAIAVLVDMGFARDDAVRVLQQTNGDVEQSVTLLSQ